MHWTPDCTRVYRPQTSVNSGASIAEQQEEAAMPSLHPAWTLLKQQGSRWLTPQCCSSVCSLPLPSAPALMSVLARDPR